MRFQSLFKILALSVLGAAQNEAPITSDTSDELVSSESSEMLSKPFIPLNPLGKFIILADIIFLDLDLLDEEINTLSALISAYDSKIAHLEQKQKHQEVVASQAANPKTRKLKVEEIKLLREDTLDYY